MKSMKIEIKELNRTIEETDGYIIPFAIHGWEKVKTIFIHYLLRILNPELNYEICFKKVKEIVESFEEEIKIVIKKDTHPRSCFRTNTIFLPQKHCFISDPARAFVLAHEFMHFVHSTIEDTSNLELCYEESVANSGAFFLLKHFNLVDFNNIYCITYVLKAAKVQISKRTFNQALKIGYVCAEKAIQNYEETQELRKFYDQYI